MGKRPVPQEKFDRAVTELNALARGIPPLATAFLGTGKKFS